MHGTCIKLLGSVTGISGSSPDLDRRVSSNTRRAQRDKFLAVIDLNEYTAEAVRAVKAFKAIEHERNTH
jgi:hypothetical protein